MDRTSTKRIRAPKNVPLGKKTKRRIPMKKMKALVSLALAAVMTLSLAACGAKPAAPASSGAASNASSAVASSAQGWKFDRRVEIMIPAKEGGGLDTTIRAFAPYLEKELGTNVVINNKDGASGTAGYTWSHNSVNDGYAFQFTAPSAILADAQGVCSFDLMSELIPVSGLTSADGLLFASKVAPFTTVEEMIDYAKAHPGEVTIATDSPKGISGAMIAEFCDQAGIELNWITSDAGEVLVSMMAGDVDLYVGTWSDAGAYVESGDMSAIVVLAPQRNEMYPDVPCSGDLGFDAQLGFFRVFTAMKGTPQEAIDAFAAAVVAASQNPEWEKWLESNGMVNEYVYTADELADVLAATHEFGAKLA